MDSRTEIRVKNLLELSSQIQFLICDHHTQHILLHVTSQKCHPCTKLLSHLVDTFPLSSHFAYRSKIDIVSTMHIICLLVETPAAVIGEQESEAQESEASFQYFISYRAVYYFQKSFKNALVKSQSGSQMIPKLNCTRFLSKCVE